MVIPIRTATGKAEPAASSTRRAWISTAARTARRASSSWATGRPKTAETASPMNFSTRPPWRSTAPRATAKYCSRKGRRTSGSWVSPRVVLPTRSQKRAVTVLRTSREEAVAPSGTPQPMQKDASAGLVLPQAGHVSMPRRARGGMARGYGETGIGGGPPGSVVGVS